MEIDGCFSIEVYTSDQYKLGAIVGLSLKIVQHSFFPGSEASRKAR